MGGCDDNGENRHDARSEKEQKQRTVAGMALTEYQIGHCLEAFAHV